MNADKALLLRNRLVPLLLQIPTETRPAWGKMTLQQMAEHFADSVRIASGKTVFTEVITPAEHLQKQRDFILSDRPFRENTVNPLLPEVPPPVRNASMAAALKEVGQELNDFFAVFEKNPSGVTRNPFFGDLNYEQNVHLLYKHALHHLKQFGAALP